MKPRIFIGSSVEGLNVAYAIQQNLTHDAEATVWDQGVFELSRTTIESLDQVLNSIDFGVFVFSPDDEVSLRGKKSKVIRDNVLFELGLFIGKLGRDRVFFVIPDGSPVPLKIPTDLIGVTPGKYNPNREDKSLQAATGAACNQIRNQFKKLGVIRSYIDREIAEESDKKDVLGNDWFVDFVNKDYRLAKEKLEKNLSEKSGDELLSDKVTIAFIDFRIDDKEGICKLNKLTEEYKNNLEVLERICIFLMWEDYTEKAREIANKVLAEKPSESGFIKIISDCYKRDGDLDKATDILNKHFFGNDPRIAIALSEIYEERKSLPDAISIIHSTYLNFPSNESVIYRYARLLNDLNKNNEALFLLDVLTTNHPENFLYWGYLSNVCLLLDLYDNAMIACKKAEDLSQGKEAWVIHNIGNILNNKGFYTDAITWLQKGLAIETTSQYAHDRLAKAIKGKEEEKERFQKICKEGRSLIRNSQFLQEKTADTEILNH